MTVKGMGNLDFQKRLIRIIWPILFTCDLRFLKNTATRQIVTAKNSIATEENSGVNVVLLPSESSY